MDTWVEPFYFDFHKDNLLIMLRFPTRIIRPVLIFGFFTFVYYQLLPHGDRTWQLDSSSVFTPKERADYIRTAFIHGWESYMKYASPHDTLKPLTKDYDDRRYVSHFRWSFLPFLTAF